MRVAPCCQLIQGWWECAGGRDGLEEPPQGTGSGVQPYLGTPGGMPGGTRTGRDGICGGAEKGSLLANTWGPGRDGMGGAEKEAAAPTGTGIRGGPGVGPRTAGGRPGGCTLDTGRRCGVGLWGQGEGCEWGSCLPSPNLSPHFLTSKSFACKGGSCTRPPPQDSPAGPLPQLPPVCPC